MNRLWLVMAAVTVLWSGAARPTLINVENAYETDAAHVRLPDDEHGQVTIRDCASCKAIILQVNRDTRYLVSASAPAVSLEQLRKAAAGAGGRLMIVFYKLDSKVVTRIVLGGAH